jgi:hypothetical protein
LPCTHLFVTGLNFKNKMGVEIVVVEKGLGVVDCDVVGVALEDSDNLHVGELLRMGEGLASGGAALPAVPWSGFRDWLVKPLGGDRRRNRGLRMCRAKVDERCVGSGKVLTRGSF